MSKKKAKSGDKKPVFRQENHESYAGFSSRKVKLELPDGSEIQLCEDMACGIVSEKLQFEIESQESYHLGTFESMVFMFFTMGYTSLTSSGLIKGDPFNCFEEYKEFLRWMMAEGGKVGPEYMESLFEKVIQVTEERKKKD